MEKRMPWADALRGVLILMIVYGHTASNGDMLKHYVYSFHVPMFFFLSGFLFSKGKGGFKAFCRKKFSTLMIPYYIFALFSIVVFTLLGSFASDKLDVALKHEQLHKSLIGMLYASAANGYMKWNIPLWFLPCMFVSQLMAYFISDRVKALLEIKRLYMLPIIASPLALSYLNYYVLRIRALPFHLESAVFLMPFFLLGVCLRKLNWNARLKTPKDWLLCLSLLISGGAIALLFNSRINYFLSSYGKITVFYASAFLSIVGVYMLFQLISNRFLEIAGQNTVPILVMHKFPVVFFQITLAPMFSKTNFAHTLAAVFIALLSACLCLLFGKILENHAPFTIGKSRK